MLGIHLTSGSWSSYSDVDSLSDQATGLSPSRPPPLNNSATPQPLLDDIDMDAIARTTMNELSSVKYFYVRTRERFDVWELQGGAEGDRCMVKLTAGGGDGWRILGEHGMDQFVINHMKMWSLH